MVLVEGMGHIILTYRERRRGEIKGERVRVWFRGDHLKGGWRVRREMRVCEWE